MSALEQIFPTTWLDFGLFLKERRWTLLDDQLNGASRALLVDLVKHLDRQAFVGHIVRRQLKGDLLAIGRQGSLAHPQKRPPVGKVPKTRGWTYTFHGKGCCLTYKDGTKIDVNFVDGRADIIDVSFYHRYLQSIADPSLIQQTLIKSDPFEETWKAELPLLNQSQLIEGSHLFEITPKGIYYGQLLAEYLDQQSTAAAKAALPFIFDTPQFVQIPEHLLHQYQQALTEKYDSRSQIYISCYEHAATATDKAAQLSAAFYSSPKKTKATILNLLKEGPVDYTMLTGIKCLGTIFDASLINNLCGVIKRAQGNIPPASILRQHALELIFTHLDPSELSNEQKQQLHHNFSTFQTYDEAVVKSLYLLAPNDGVDALAKALKAPNTMNRISAAAVLLVLADIDSQAIRIIQRTQNAEANYTRALYVGFWRRQWSLSTGMITKYKGRSFYIDRPVMKGLEPFVPQRIKQHIENLRMSYLPIVRRWVSPS